MCTEVLCLAVMCLYVRANWTGPPVDPVTLPEWLQGDARHLLAVEGELPQELMYCSMALLVAWRFFNTTLVETVARTRSTAFVTLCVWKAR